MCRLNKSKGRPTHHCYVVYFGNTSDQSVDLDDGGPVIFAWRPVEMEIVIVGMRKNVNYVCEGEVDCVGGSRGSIISLTSKEVLVGSTMVDILKEE